MAGEAASICDIPEEDELRAHQYRFLARWLARPADQDLLDLTASLEGDDTDYGMALNALAHEARKATPEAAEDEFFDLFIGIGRGELVPHGSYYLTGFLNEKPLAELRQDMAQLGIASAKDNKIPEDHIAAQYEMMNGLILGTFGSLTKGSSLGLQSGFFNRHIFPWAGTFFADLDTAKTARLYKPLGRMGTAFMKIEETAFQMAA